jgi:hypothetical protein
VITSPPYINFTVAKCLTHIGTEGGLRLIDSPYAVREVD